MRMAFVLTNSKRLPSQSAVEQALKGWPDLGAPTWLGDAKPDSMALEAGGIEVMAALMPSPVPNGEADAATEHSISGVSRQWTLPAHSTHLVCILRQGDSGIAEMVRFTRVVAALAKAARAVGVYWGEGHVTHHPDLFVELASSDLPLPLWVGVSLAGNRKGVELLSIGMKQLGLPDLLLTAPEMSGGALEFFYDLLGYVTRRGEALPEGDTVGRSEHEHYSVHYVPSPVDANVKVWRVQLGLPAGSVATVRKLPVKKAAKKSPAHAMPAAKKAPSRKKPAAKKARGRKKPAARKTLARRRAR
ncbi:MAG: DUF4261 domain-containing protein [Myxococcota bacterium]